MVEHHEGDDQALLLVDHVDPARPEAGDEGHHPGVQLLGATHGAHQGHAAVRLRRAQGHRPGHGRVVVGGLGAVFAPVAVGGEGRTRAVLVLDGLEVVVGGVDHQVAGRPLAGRHVGDQGRPGADRVGSRAGRDRAVDHVLDLGDPPVDQLQPDRDLDRSPALLHHPIEHRLAGGRIDRIDLEAGRGFRGADPQPLADVDLLGVLGEAHALRQWQARRVVAHQGVQVLVQDLGHAGAWAVKRRRRPRA